MIRFPSIEQFRNVAANVHKHVAFKGLDEQGRPQYESVADKPTLSFEGTVKLHGTNAAVVFHGDGSPITFQSRERVLTVGADNCGFLAAMEPHGEDLDALGKSIIDTLGLRFISGDTLAVFGEWCGGNIQKGVALSGLPKMFVVFAVRFNDEWQDLSRLANVHCHKAGIYNVREFGSWTISIDFNDPKEAQNVLAQLTLEVEKECPVGKAFGVSGIGEGIVWRCISDGWNRSEFWMKVKGAEHSASKVRTLATVDIERHRLVSGFIDATVTEQRMEQGLQNLTREQMKPFAMESMGDFLRWVIADIAKEEADTMEANGMTVKELGGGISNKAKKWFLARLNAKESELA